MTDFFIADLHLGHKRIIEFSRTQFSTIEEHNEVLVANWNSVVRPKGDRVFVLGDVAFGKHNLEYLARMNGDKILVSGNHDCYSTDEYRKYFFRIQGVMEYKFNSVLSHIPMDSDELIPLGDSKPDTVQNGRWSYSIHGHLHGRKKNDPRYICVSCEHIDCTPISWEQMIERYDLQNVKQPKTVAL